MVADRVDIGWPSLLLAVALVLVVLALFLWLVRRGLASEADLGGVAGEIATLKQRVSDLETTAERLPTRDELHHLSLITGQLAGRIEMIGARSDERHEEFHLSLAALERKIDGMLQELRTPLHLIMQAFLEDSRS